MEHTENKEQWKPMLNRSDCYESIRSKYYSESDFVLVLKLIAGIRGAFRSHAFRCGTFCI